jgi:hypothetical protein
MERRMPFDFLFLLALLLPIVLGQSAEDSASQPFQYSSRQSDPAQRTVIMRLEPVSQHLPKNLLKFLKILQLPNKPPFMNQAEPPRAVPQQQQQAAAQTRHVPSPNVANRQQQQQQQQQLQQLAQQLIAAQTVNNK